MAMLDYKQLIYEFIQVNGIPKEGLFYQTQTTLSLEYPGEIQLTLNPTEKIMRILKIIHEFLKFWGISKRLKSRIQWTLSRIKEHGQIKVHNWKRKVLNNYFDKSDNEERKMVLISIYYIDKQLI